MRYGVNNRRVADTRRQGLVAVGVYTSLVLAWAYGVLNNASLSDNSAPDPFWNGPIPWMLLAALDFLVGFCVGRWWALAVFLLPTVLAIPAGFEPDGYPEIPIAAFLALRVGVFYLPVTAAGVLARKVLGRSLGSTRSS